MIIEGIEIGVCSPCRAVAEISNNHNGSFDRALRLINAAKAAGADFVKFQAYAPDELVALRGDGPAPEPWGSQGWTMRALYEKAQTPLEWFPDLFAHARKIGIVPFASVFGEESLAVLQSVDCPAYKIARLDSRDCELRRLARMPRKPTIVSYSGGESTLGLPGADLRLWCPPGYPQVEFSFGQKFTDDCYGEPPEYDGFSYHGTDPFVPIVAAISGAKMIEVHFQLNDEPSELEASVSLNVTEFAFMVQSIRSAEAMLT